MIQKEKIEILLEGNSFSAYVARPNAIEAPVVLVIQEIFGVSPFIREFTDFLAQQGYIAVAPDLFWRLERDVSLSDRVEKEREKAIALYRKFDVEAGMSDLLATLHQVRHLKGSTGKVGTVGFCLGGRLAYLMATRSDADANVSYYAAGLI